MRPCSLQEVLEGVEAVRREQLGDHYLAELLPVGRVVRQRHGTEFLAWSLRASGTDRVANTASCVCKNSRAASGVDATTVVIVPRLRDMTGP
jgi:hypothetical protein